MVKWEGMGLWDDLLAAPDAQWPAVSRTIHISTRFTKKEKRSKKERNNCGDGPPNLFVQPYGCSPLSTKNRIPSLFHKTDKIRIDTRAIRCSKNGNGLMGKQGAYKEK